MVEPTETRDRRRTLENHTTQMHRTKYMYKHKAIDSIVPHTMQMQTDDRLSVSLPPILDEDYATLSIECSHRVAKPACSIGSRRRTCGSFTSVDAESEANSVDSGRFSLQSSSLFSCTGSFSPKQQATCRQCARKSTRDARSRCSEGQAVVLNLVLHFMPWAACLSWILSEWISLSVASALS